MVLTMPICDLADWHIKVQPVIIHNRWYSQVYRRDGIILFSHSLTDFGRFTLT